MKPFLFFLTLLLAAPYHSQAQTGKVHQMTLEECVEYALTHQPSVNRSRLNIDISQKDVKEVTASGLPQVTGQVQVNDYLVLPTSIIPAGVFGPEPVAVQFGTKYNVSAGVSINQLIFDGTFFLGLKAAKEYVQLSRIQYSRSQRDVRASVSKAYYSVLVNEQRIDVLNQQRLSLKELLDNTTKLYDNDLAEKLDVNRLQVNYNNLETEIEKLKGLVELSRVLLKFQMGMPADEELVLTSKLSADAFNPQADTTRTLDITRRLEYTELQQGIYLTELNERRYRYGYLPTLSAFGNFQYQNLSNDFARNDNWYGLGLIGLQLNIPIFDGMRKSAQIQRTRIERMQLEFDSQNLENSLNVEYQQARILYLNALRQLEIQNRNRTLSQEVYDNVKLKYTEGVGSNLEVVQAEAEKNQSQTNYFNAMLEAYIARVDLLKALGDMDKQP